MIPPVRHRRPIPLRSSWIVVLIFISTLVLPSLSTSIADSSQSTPKPAIIEQPDSTTSSIGSTDNDVTCSSALDIASFLSDLRAKYAHQSTFLQAVEEMALSLQPLFEDPERGDFYKRAFLVMAEPERTVSFRVAWVDDGGIMRVNRGWRVEFSSVLGPYKGGLRFHPTVDEGVLKFLGFEQMFKNALTGLPLGGGKGGSDFDPKGKSSREVQSFCESFMTELHRHIHPSTDVPAGDIGVGGREIGFMLGQYKRITNRHGEGVLTGKPLDAGGSLLRPEATGYGLVYIAKLATSEKGRRPLKGARCAVSGSGNVAQYAVEKLMEFGAKVVTMSDSGGVLVFEKGMTREDWEEIVKAKQVDRIRLSAIEDKVTGSFVPNESPWTVQPSSNNYEYAFPCATQNEIDGPSARHLVENGVVGFFEGANLPITLDGQSVLKKAAPSGISKSDGVIYIPGKAANAGGVGVSGLEMSQNAQHLSWKAEEVDNKLKGLMEHIYAQLISGGGGTLDSGANWASFRKVVNGMKDLGWVS
eukprot:CAMPEP_0198248922 /NCGR_PEP_ID=MMETSP1447-20131203/570_1 /TAXON_ID=420782 /ORGANISM="Chaetoceros dichaeta, Strain CCMP1751" /LENGTH=528 /DNA_ID=CAMNT_0043933421 /DNA_START=53 /DNA_END=1639 /DNA_ORIENTATION=-